MAVDILVTGASGSLGRQIVSTLRAEKCNVIASGRVAGENVDAEWDVSQNDSPYPACRPTVVVHAAARIGSYRQSLGESVPLFEVNVSGALRVARWCVSEQVRHLILVSGAIVYGKWSDAPKSEEERVEPWAAGPYAVSKWCSEQVASLVQCAGVQLTVLRMSSLYGTGYSSGLVQRLIRDGRDTGQISLEPPFDDKFDLLHVSDAAQAVKRVIQANRAGLWNIGSGGVISIQELGEKCAAEIRVPLVCSTADPARDGRIINWINDQRARDELGHKNLVSLEWGIAEIAKSVA